LVEGKVINHKQEKVRIDDNCVFDCYVVADIEGDLKTQVRGWRKTPNGRGRWTDLSGDYRGTIEVIEWKDLVLDARARNRAFIEAAGL
jgi:hypothetical protein